MSSFNQFTMVQLTMRKCKSQFPNPTSQIARPGRLSQLSQMFHASQMFAMFAMFSMFPLFAMFAMFSRTRDAWKKKQNTKKCGIRKAECRCGGPRVSKGLSSNAEFGSSVSVARASARAHLRNRNSESGLTIGRLKPGLKTQSVSSVSRISGVSFLSFVSTVSGMYGLDKK